MNWFNTTAILIVAYLVVFLEATFNELRHFIGVQVDLLPGLMVYTAVHCGMATLTLLAVCGGLWFDSLSANPMGLSTLPLFLIGLFLQHNRDAILRDQPYAQMLLGLTASALAPLICLLILVNTGARPVVGWFSLWQWLVMSVAGGAVTPVWFWLFDWLSRIFNYRPIPEAAFRQDRQIKRGKQ